MMAAIVITGATLRVAVTSVGAELPAIRAALHLSSAAAGWLTALPVLCFAVLGAATPLLARRVGPRGLMAAVLLVSALGLAGRAVAGSAWAFLLCTVVSLASGAVGNVLMPRLVRQHGAGRPGAATALYTAALALASAAAAAGSTAIARQAGWRWGIGAWPFLDVAAAASWLPPPRPREWRGPPRARAVPAAGGCPASRRVALLAAFFGFQSVQSYTVFGWFPTLLRDCGTSAAQASTLVGAYAVVAVPVYLVAPRLAVRRMPAAIVALGLCQVVAYLGLAAGPAGLAWLWMILAGTGSGAFAMALRLIADAGTRAGSATSVSAVVQGSGYLLAAAGPLLVGLVHDVTGGWTGSLALLGVAAVISTASGLASLRRVAGQERAGDSSVNLDSQKNIPT